MLNKLLLSLVARSVTPPSPPTSPSEMMERGDDTARSTLWGPSAACTSILDRVCYDPPDEHTSAGGRDDRRGPVPCGIDPIKCSSAQTRYFDFCHPLKAQVLAEGPRFGAQMVVIEEIDSARQSMAHQTRSPSHPGPRVRRRQPRSQSIWSTQEPEKEQELILD